MYVPNAQRACSLFDDRCVSCCRLVFDWRTFYMSASSEQDMKEWINVITWRLVILTSGISNKSLNTCKCLYLIMMEVIGVIP